jgi:plastocyanin
MSRNQRIGLLAAAAVVVVVAIVVAVASGGGDDNTTAQTTTQEQSGGTGTQTTSSGTSTTPAPDSFKVQIKDEKPVGGAQNFKVKKGDNVTIVVSSDAHDVIHLHGYDIEKDVEAGKPATFKFTADIEGIFEIESHVAEDKGLEPLMAKLTVEPN